MCTTSVLTHICSRDYLGFIELRAICVRRAHSGRARAMLMRFILCCVVWMRVQHHRHTALCEFAHFITRKVNLLIFAVWSIYVLREVHVWKFLVAVQIKSNMLSVCNSSVHTITICDRLRYGCVGIRSVIAFDWR